MTGAYCTFPAIPPFNPLRLASNYRDYFGDANALLTELTDQIIASGCYVPKIFHAPETFLENEGVTPNGYLAYTLVIPPGSFILAYMHAFTSAASVNATDPPVQPGFRMQITDVLPNHKFFGKPLPETFFLNDIPSANPQSPNIPTFLSVQNNTPRLLTAPYPVVPPGVFKVEFWNILTNSSGVGIQNNLVRMSFLVAIPDPDKRPQGKS
jgi:hypothetical protein